MPHAANLAPLLHWVAPRTAHKALIANNPWLPAACMRGAALFADKALHGPATVLAAAHEAAIDYLTQAPVLVVAAAAKSDLALREHREQAAAHFKVVCSVRPRLRDVMRHYGLAPQLRALSGQALRQDHRRLLKALSEVPPSRLAQTIPGTPAEQTAWLAAAEEWRRLALRLTPDTDWIVAWAAGNSCHLPTGAIFASADLIDFACRNREAFDTSWSIAEASLACERWHEAIVRQIYEVGCTAEQLAAVADYGPLPDEAVVDGHMFVALRTRPRIYEEGRAMHHCVATYAEQVFAGRCWIYSVVRGDERIATLELRPAANGFALAQIKAHCNRPPPAGTTVAAVRFLAAINDAVAMVPEALLAAAPEAEQRPQPALRRRQRAAK